MPFAPDVKILFNLDGERKTLDYRRLPFSAWSELKKALDFTPASLLGAWLQNDIEAVGAIIWLERKQTDRALKWSTVRMGFERYEPEFEPVGACVDGEAEYLPGFEPESDPGSESEDEADPTQAGS